MSTSAGRVGEFIRGVREEMERVSWPSREELIGSIVVVFVGVFLLACYIGALDYFLSKFVHTLLQ